MRNDGDERMSPYDAARLAVNRAEELFDIKTYDELQNLANHFQKRRIEREWDVLMLNAQRRVNQDKKFICVKCAVGYQEEVSRCLACDGHVFIDHESWDQAKATEQQTEQLPLLREKKHRQLLEQSRHQEERRYIRKQRETQKWNLAEEERRRGVEERFRRVGEMEAQREYESQELELERWDGMERAQEEWLDELALDALADDPWTPETIVIWKNLPQRTEKELRTRKALADVLGLQKELEQELKSQREAIRDARDQTWQDALEAIPVLQNLLQELTEEVNDLRVQISRL